MTLPTSMRRYVAIAAVIAFSLLLLRPACDVLALQLPGTQGAAVAQLHHDSGPGAERGDVLQIGSHGASLAAVGSAAKGLLIAPASISLALAVPALVLLSRVAPPGAAPPPSRSYYIRSARILR